MNNQMKDTFIFKFGLPENIEKLPQWLGVAPLCKHVEKCPKIQYLSNTQLKLLKALQANDMKTIKNIAWVTTYNSLKTFETLGLITIPHEIYSFNELEQFEIKLLKKSFCSCKFLKNNKNFN